MECKDYSGNPIIIPPLPIKTLDVAILGSKYNKRPPRLPIVIVTDLSVKEEDMEKTPSVINISSPPPYHAN